MHGAWVVLGGVLLGDQGPEGLIWVQLRRRTARLALSPRIASVIVEWLWTWKGRCFGYRDADDLWTYTGRHVGRFDGDEVYGRDGRYLGELRNSNRLITSRAKGSHKRGSFTPHANRAAYAKYADYAGYAMYAGYDDFPELEM